MGRWKKKQIIMTGSIGMKRTGAHPRNIVEVGQVIMHAKPLVCVGKAAGTGFAADGVVDSADTQRDGLSESCTGFHILPYQ